MQSIWQVQEAKNRFSELIELSLQFGPQTVTKHGRPVVQIVPVSTPVRGIGANAVPGSMRAVLGDAFTVHLLNVPRNNVGGKLGIESPKRRNRKLAPF